ncbi:uncharacterized protein LOC127730484 [Mytilus californianus]|uniref:uncharacterized protein LOC127730484 n=1 Tax=Mytilus californianus TaxID=6549 RepID=UPI0022476334|nr:uncharacterized protein LOC127730484 [Mytilus californianus]
MELSGKICIIICAFMSVSNGQYELKLNAVKEFILVGATPKYVCTVNQNANFLIGNPLKWEKRGRDGSKVVISVLANVEEGLSSEYNVQLDTTDSAMSFTLSFLQGIKEEYDGHFACVLYNKSNTVLAEKMVEVNVIQTIKKTEFEIGDNKQAVAGEPALPIRLEEGTYKTICKTEGSNPAAVVKIYLDTTEEMGNAQVEVLDTSRTQPPQVYNVEKTVTINLKPDDNKKILKCVATVNNDDSMKTEISYELEVFSIPPEISCSNSTAMKGNKFVELTCMIKVAGITCESENIFWENGNNGDRYAINYKQKGLRVFCLMQVKGSVSTTLRIDAVTDDNFKTDYFVVYVNKHQTTTRKQAVLNQDYSGAPSLQNIFYLMCSALLAAILL